MKARVFKKMYLRTKDQLVQELMRARNADKKIVLTQGSYDMVHIGHARYLDEAKSHGDMLIVGVDSDQKIKKRKGPNRPVVPQRERLEMLTHLHPVDYVFLKEVDEPKWHLIKLVRPDILIATKETYSKDELKKLKAFCGKVVVLKPMATTSTSAKIRKLQIGAMQKIEKVVAPKIISAVKEIFNDIKI